VLDGLIEDDTGPEVALEDRARRLARSEAGDPCLPRQTADSVVDGPAQAIGRELDLEHDGRSRAGGGSDLHREESIGRASGRGRWTVAYELAGQAGPATR
jgi:hypothetical protein